MSDELHVSDRRKTQNRSELGDGTFIGVIEND